MPVALVDFTYGVCLLLLLVTGIAAGYWVYSDATARGSSAALRWAIASVLCVPVGLYYLIRYRRRHEPVRQLTYRNHVAALVTVCGVQSVLIAALFAPHNNLSRSGFILLSFAFLLPVYRYLLL